MALKMTINQGCFFGFAFNLIIQHKCTTLPGQPESQNARKMISITVKKLKLLLLIIHGKKPPGYFKRNFLKFPQTFPKNF